MNKIGVVEGFFGPAWPDSSRLSYAEFIEKTGGGFYIYAPKQDPYLRKKWREDWPADFLSKLSQLAQKFKKHNVIFGVGLSPFGLGKKLSTEDRELLSRKLKQLQELGVELLGLFFDDMPSDENLAQTQIECVKMVQQHFHNKIVFCPSYYTPDPILDKVFGTRPVNYLEEIAQGIDREVAFAWTGPKVISPEISNAHLAEVTELLKRKPFIWENIFANDGPKNCKFLKLKTFSGRENGALDKAEAFAFNMMNQAELSKILFLSSRLVLEKQVTPEVAWRQALDELVSMELSQLLEANKASFLEEGLDKIPSEKIQNLIREFSEFDEPAAHEIVQWLKGNYIVGTECLTD